VGLGLLVSVCLSLSEVPGTGLGLAPSTDAATVSLMATVFDLRCAVCGDEVLTLPQLPAGGDVAGVLGFVDGQLKEVSQCVRFRGLHPGAVEASAEQLHAEYMRGVVKWAPWMGACGALAGNGVLFLLAFCWFRVPSFRRAFQKLVDGVVGPSEFPGRRDEI
jgi:hypothetical protein